MRFLFGYCYLIFSPMEYSLLNYSPNIVHLAWRFFIIWRLLLLVLASSGSVMLLKSFPALFQLCLLWICFRMDGCLSFFIFLLPSLNPWEQKHHNTCKFLQMYTGSFKWFKWVLLTEICGQEKKKEYFQGRLLSLSTLALFLCFCELGGP